MRAHVKLRYGSSMSAARVKGVWVANGPPNLVSESLDYLLVAWGGEASRVTITSEARSFDVIGLEGKWIAVGGQQCLWDSIDEAIGAQEQ